MSNDTIAGGHYADQPNYATIGGGNNNWCIYLDRDRLAVTPLQVGQAPGEQLDVTPPGWTGEYAEASFTDDYLHVVLHRNDPARSVNLRASIESVRQGSPRWQRARWADC